MARVVLDSSVVIALLKPADKHHFAVKKAFVDSEENFLISTITIVEALVRPAMNSRADANHKASLLYEYFGAPISLTSEIALLAAVVRANTGLATPDAIVSATASVNKATLWTCDASLAKLHKGAHLIA